jgi:hypothetical protein
MQQPYTRGTIKSNVCRYKMGRRALSSNQPVYAVEAAAVEAAAFLGVFSFLAAAGFLAVEAFFAAGLAVVFATRPDLVLVREAGLSTTAGAAASAFFFGAAFLAAVVEAAFFGAAFLVAAPSFLAAGFLAVAFLAESFFSAAGFFSLGADSFLTGADFLASLVPPEAPRDHVRRVDDDDMRCPRVDEDVSMI